jgi:S-adenosylmethionine synthetase
MRQTLFTSESVAAGHPDKVCDQVSDAVLDLYLERDPLAKVAVETIATTNFVALIGEVSGRDAPSLEIIEDTVRHTIKEIGYTQKNFHYKTLTFQNRLHEQSPDIARGLQEGAGDQGIMFGYATHETEALIPAPLYYAHRILEDLSAFRHNQREHILGPDAKSQVTMVYEKGHPVAVDTVVLSTQHHENVEQEALRFMLIPLIKHTLKAYDTTHTTYHINPTGRFVIGGPDGDAGLTGRKIIVDTYGGAAPHGGGAFCGKDPSKVDRSAAYMARYLAKNIVASGICDTCLIQLSYAIGVAKPVSMYMKCDEGIPLLEDKLCAWIFKNIPLTPNSMRQHLHLDHPIYKPTAVFGHFGRIPYKQEELWFFPWEKGDLVESLKGI